MEYIDFMKEEDVKKMIEKLVLYKKFKTNIKEVCKKQEEDQITPLWGISNHSILKIKTYCIDCIHENSMNVYINEVNCFGSRICDSLHDYIKITIECVADNTHKMDFILHVEDDIAEIVGAYPNKLKLKYINYKKYEKHLKKHYKALINAEKVHEIEASAGAFVYLRRIFEDIIEEKHMKADLNEKDEDDYKNNNMKKKVKMLKSDLSNIISENCTDIYGVLSKGVHQLTDEECSQYFYVMRDLIISILDEELSKIENEKNTKKVINGCKKIKKEIS